MHFLHGICFDTSGFEANHVYIEAFMQPLFVPTDHLAFTFGKRLSRGRGRRVWDFGCEADEVMPAVAAAIKREALPLFEELADLPQFAANASRLAEDDENPGVLEPIGYVWVLLGEPESARRTLERAVSIEEQADYPVAERKERMKRILQLVSEGEIEDAVAILGEWRKHTLRALRLE